MGEHVVSTGAQMCGYSFNPGDIVWSCRNCQADDTCVMCERCFANSDHSGHDTCFNFIPSDLPPGSGGCCDCGDPEAWDSRTFCPDHKTSADSDPLEGVPRESVVEHVSFVIESAMDMILMQLHDRPLSPDLRDMTNLRSHPPHTFFPKFKFAGNLGQAFHGETRASYWQFRNELLWKVFVTWLRNLCKRLPVVCPIVARAMKKTGFLDELITNTRRCGGPCASRAAQASSTE